MKRFSVTTLLVCLLMLVACQADKGFQGKEKKAHKMDKYEMTFYDTFDTVTKSVLYAQSQEEADRLGKILHDGFMDLHKQYDKYHTYDGINNIKTINDRAGQGPVKVSPELMDLLEFSLDQYRKHGKTNIGIGALTEIWSDYRDGHEEGVDALSEDQKKKPHEAKLPPIEELKEASQHMNIENLILDREKMTVEIKDPKMRLDVGAVAKGYATELIAKKMKEAGLVAGLISAGGNVRIIGRPPETDRAYFGVGIQNPDAVHDTSPSVETMKDVLYVNDVSVVTSGDYQRFYTVEGKIYHHIIDPETLMPADYFRSVTIVAKDSGLCDFLSTSVFCLPYEEGKRLVDSIDGVEAYWIQKDGSINFTKGLEKSLKSQGATNQEKR